MEKGRKKNLRVYIGRFDNYNYFTLGNKFWSLKKLASFFKIK